MQSVRWSRFMLLGMVVLITLLPVGTAWAVAPERETWHFEATWLFETCDGFEVWEHFSADVEATYYYDADGNLVRTIEHWTDNGVVYNESNPRIWLQEETVHNVALYDENGELTGGGGRLVHIILPGEGLIFIAAGTFFDCEDAVCASVAGHNDWADGDKDALCEALSGS